MSGAYACVLCRDTTPGPGPPEVYGEELAELLGEFPEVGAVVALCWPHARRAPFVHYGGPWITGEAEGP